MRELTPVEKEWMEKFRIKFEISNDRYAPLSLSLEQLRQFIIEYGEACVHEVIEESRKRLKELFEQELSKI